MVLLKGCAFVATYLIIICSSTPIKTSQKIRYCLLRLHTINFTTLYVDTKIKELKYYCHC